MAMHAPRLARLFTSTYARRINAQIVYPSESHVVKPNELESALVRPLQVAVYEPHRPAAFLAATLAFGLIKGHPFMDGNKRTAFFLTNEYLRAQGLPGLTALPDQLSSGMTSAHLRNIADLYIAAAASVLDVEAFASNLALTSLNVKWFCKY